MDFRLDGTLFFLMKLIAFMTCMRPLNPFTRLPGSLLTAVHHVAMLSPTSKISNVSLYPQLLKIRKARGTANICWETRCCAVNVQFFYYCYVNVMQGTIEEIMYKVW